MYPALTRKLLREVWRLRGQMVSISLVVACGVMTVVTMRSNYESLEASRIAFYEEYHFADIFASLVRAPESLLPRIEAIEGVALAEARVVLEVSLDVPGLEEPAIGRLVSIPDAGLPTLNGLHLAGGRLPEPGRGDEVVASAAFAGANGLEIGDSLGAVINGRWERLRIVGIGKSPEFVYEISAGQLFPDNRRFGVLWIPRGSLAAAAGMEGAFNDVSLKLARGGTAPAAIAELDRLLDGYGALGAYDRERQVSHRILSDELAQTRVTGTIIPAIFLGVAAFLLHIVLTRLVRTQREQIAVLKAFGYSNLEIGGHYLQFAMIMVGAGALLGTGVGIWLGRLLLGVYAQYFQFPALIFQTSWPLLAGAIVVSGLAAGLGAISAVRAAVALPPAEAMRPEAPARFRPGWLERIGLGRLFSPVGRMVIRSLERQPVRAALSALGVGMSVAILLVGAFMFGAVDFMAELQFRAIQREDLTVVFSGPRSAAVRHDLGNLAGVTRVETFRSVPIRLRSGHRTRQVGLTGLEPDAELRRILDTDRTRHPVPEQGVLLTDRLAELMGVAAGDTLQMEIIEGRQRTRTVVVTGTIEEMFGLNAYMEISALNRLLREGPVVSGAYLRVDEARGAELNEWLKRAPGVAGVAARSTVLENFERQLEQNLLVSMSMLVLFAGVIAVGVVYNGARIALSERGRELASLRVLGFTKHEVAVILFGEQATVTAIGIPLGFAIGTGLSGLIIASLDSETYRFPLLVTNATYAFAGIVGLLAAALAGLLVRRRLTRLDLIEVLKTRE